jgi:DNA-binding NarL/FixJ family response regulator
MSFKSILLQEIAEIIGEVATKQLVAAKGGGRIRIPAKILQTHWLAKTIGFEAAQALASHFTSGYGTLELELPISEAGAISKFRVEIFRLIEEGMSSDKIARTVGVSRRTVLRNRAKLRAQREANRPKRISSIKSHTR